MAAYWKLIEKNFFFLLINSLPRWNLCYVYTSYFSLIYARFPSSLDHPRIFCLVSPASRCSCVFPWAFYWHFLCASSRPRGSRYSVYCQRSNIYKSRRISVPGTSNNQPCNKHIIKVQFPRNLFLGKIFTIFRSVLFYKYYNSSSISLKILQFDLNCRMHIML